MPLATLSGARDKIRELRSRGTVNDTIFVKILPGTYRLTEPFVLTDEDAGTVQSPVVYTAATAERPVICGGIETARFEVVKPGLWRVFIPEARYGFRFEQLYVNGERRFRAQTPNRGAFLKIKHVETDTLSRGKVNADYYGKVPDFALQKIYPMAENAHILYDIAPGEAENVVLAFNHVWTHTKMIPSHIGLKDSCWYISGKGLAWDHGIRQNSRYVVENYRKALDAPGEWFLDNDGWLWYIPMPGETPEQTHCIAPVTDKFISIRGKSGHPVQHIRFENIRFEVAGYRTPVYGYTDPQAAVSVQASVMLDFAKYIDFINCDVAHTGIHAVWFREECSHSRLEHCHLYDLGGGGVKIGTTFIPSEQALTGHITVHNNIIHHGGYTFPPGVGVIIFNGSDNQITHNEIADFRYSGVSVGWVWGYSHSPSKRNTVAFNHIHHLGWGELCDMGGVYTLGASEGTIVSNNVIHDVYSHDYGGWGLYTDEGSYDIVMENNLVYNCKNSGFHQHYGKENKIRNNIFALNLIYEIQFSREEDHLSYSFTNNIVYFDKGDLITFRNEEDFRKANIRYDYNCYWDTRGNEPVFYGHSFAEWKKLGRDVHTVIADPLFVDPVNGDFRFKNEKVIRNIKFKPFDYSKAGVYGSDEWKQKAQMSAELLQQFQTVKQRFVK
jgi:parallel beta-helix repeat protein